MNLLYEQLNNGLIGILIINNASAIDAIKIKNLILGEQEKGMNSLILDMSHCQKIDYTFAAVLLVLYRKLISAGYTLKLVCLQPEVRKRLERARLLNLFDVYSSKQEALKTIEFENRIS